LLYATVVTLVLAACAGKVMAVTTTYEFVPDPNALRTGGGIHGQGFGTFSIEGQFQLSVDFDVGIALFEQVDATLYKEIPYYDYDKEDILLTQSLCVLFSMTELESTYVSETTIDFVLERNIPSFPGADIYLSLTFIDDMVHLTGHFGMPLADGYWYNLDAVAVPESATLLIVSLGLAGLLARKKGS
jgi:hypothetical protein